MTAMLPIACPCGRRVFAGEGPGPNGRMIGETPGLREAWHRGRRAYFVWLFTIEEPSVVARARESTARLGALVEPSPSPSPHARLHVTALVNGFPDELPPDLCAAQRHAVEEAQPKAPLVRVHGPALSFVSVQLPVCDCEKGIRAVRRALRSASEALGHREPRESPYAPHVTVGNVTDSVRASALYDALTPQGDAEPIALRLTRLLLVALDTRSYHAPWETVDEIVLP